MRKAMGLIQAIIMILLISGMMLIVLKYASISAKHISDTYVKEQCELFLDSTIEQALLKISFYDRESNDKCLASFSPKSVTKRGVTYSASVKMIRYYLADDSDDLDYCSTLGVSIDKDSGSHGMTLFEVEINATRADGTVLSRILRRTLQQP